MIEETGKRSVVKTISWRLLATIALFVIGGLITGSWGIATALIGVDIVVKSILYYAHERLWNKLNYGRKLVEMEGTVIWFTGLSGSGKTTLADAIAKRLRKRMLPVKRLDGDVARSTFSKNLGFSKDDRDENNKRAVHVASYLAIDNIVLASFISPFTSQRDYARSLCDNYIEVYVKCPVDVCAKRDPKGLYKKAMAGEIKGLTGFHQDAPYEAPRLPDIVVDTEDESIQQSADKVIEFLEARGSIR